MLRNSQELELLLELLEEAFDRRSWHGPNLRGGLRGVSAAEAIWRPNAGRHCIAEHVVHVSYWKYIVRRRLRPDKRGSFPLNGSNWFPITDPWTGRAWRDCLTLLDTEHTALRAVVAALPPDQLLRPRRGSTTSNRQMISGIAYHDIYHAGQIQLLKRMQRQEVGEQ